MVDVPAEGHLLHLVREQRDARMDGWMEVCPTVVCGSDSYLPGDEKEPKRAAQLSVELPQKLPKLDL